MARCGCVACRACSLVVRRRSWRSCSSASVREGAAGPPSAWRSDVTAGGTHRRSNSSAFNLGAPLKLPSRSMVPSPRPRRASSPYSPSPSLSPPVPSPASPQGDRRLAAAADDRNPHLGEAIEDQLGEEDRKSAPPWLCGSICVLLLSPSPMPCSDLPNG